MHAGEHLVSRHDVHRSSRERQAHAAYCMQTSQAAMPAGVCAVRGPAARGLLALGTLSGAVLLVDPRKGYGVEHTLAAHASGLADLDARGDLLATCGYGLRHGQVVSDLYVKVGK